MAVNTQSFSVTVANAKSVVQGAASALIDFSVGAISLAYMQAVTAIAMWLQGIGLQIAALTRFATSTGTDADSWAADYGFYRLAAVAATGTVTFSRYTPTLQALIPAGTTVQTADGTEQFVVIGDTTQGAWNATLNSYVIAASTASCNATVQALVPGTGGNVTAGVITVIGSSIVGVDTVTNASAFTSGVTSESDSAFKARFVLYLESLTEGTPAAVLNAADNVQLGASAFLTENQNYSGFSQPGYFYVVVDDGTGSPSSPFLTAEYAAIDKVRAIGTSFGVFAVVVVTANVALTIAVGAGYNGTTVAALVSTALTAYINALPEGGTLPLSRIDQVAYDASPGVTNVTAVTINSATADLVSTGQQRIKIGTCVVTT